MGYEFKRDIDKKYDTIDKLCDRIDLELDEKYPWIVIVKYLVERIRILNKEENKK